MLCYLYYYFLLQLVGPEVSRLFRKEVSIKNLPPLMKKPKASRHTLEDTDDKDVGLSVLFQQAAAQTPVSH